MRIEPAGFVGQRVSVVDPAGEISEPLKAWAERFRLITCRATFHSRYQPRSVVMPTCDDPGRSGGNEETRRPKWPGLTKAILGDLGRPKDDLFFLFHTKHMRSYTNS